MSTHIAVHLAVGLADLFVVADLLLRLRTARARRAASRKPRSRDLAKRS